MPGQRVRGAELPALVIAVVGAALLWGTFHAARGSAAFWIVGYALAAVWVLGSFAVARVEAGSTDPRTIGVAAGAGVAAFVVFYGAYRLLREIPVISGALHGVVGTADAAHVVPVLVLAVVNAVAEEVFFRGAVFSLIASRTDGRGDAVIWSTVIYAVVTAASFNVALVIAAVVLGALLAMVRQWAGGVVAPAITHVVWSTLMLLALHR